MLQARVNQLTGSIPSFLAAQNKISYVNLYNNQLSGTIPCYFAEFERLTYFNVAGNSLTGRIPDYFFSLPRAETLRFNYNFLYASITVERRVRANIT